MQVISNFKHKNMKTALKTILFVLLSIVFLDVKAQNADCNGYFAYKQGTKFELTCYDKKDKISTQLKYEVKKNVSSGNKTAVFFYNETLDDKGKLLAKGDYSIECKDGQIYADVRNISAFAAPKTADIAIDITGDKIIYPHNLSKGQKLADANMQIKGSMADAGINIMNMKMYLTNRMVEGFEKVTTPAGTFECVKISYDNEVKGGFFNFSGKTTEYLSKGIGIVKSESFDKKGKKSSSMLLTKLDR